MGWPASLGEFVAEFTLEDVRPGPGEVRTNSWKLALERISALSPGNARSWIEECLNRGYLERSVPEEGEEVPENP